MNEKQKLFAFKLAAKNEKAAQPASGKWKARDGVSIAGCTQGPPFNEFRYAHPLYGADMGVYC